MSVKLLVCLLSVLLRRTPNFLNVECHGPITHEAFEPMRDFTSLFGGLNANADQVHLNATTVHSVESKIFDEIRIQPHQVEPTMETVVVPARKVCPKGWLDPSIEACVFLDRNDKTLPQFTCPENTKLDGDYCYGRIVSDYETHCPKNFPANEDDLCVRAIVYTPSRIVCPEGYNIRAFTSNRIKQCVKVLYKPPIARDVIPQPSSPTDSKCSGAALEEKLVCPKGSKTLPLLNKVLECPEGHLIKAKKSGEAVCRVRLVVPPETRESCRKGYAWTVIENAGAACLRLQVFESVKQCPGPTPKFGPGFGDWETPSYKYHAKDRCVAFRAKAIGGKCPNGYTLEATKCFRKLILPYHYDCNNAEGFGFYYNSETKRGECKFHFDPRKWVTGTNYATKRENLESLKLVLFSTPYEIKESAYNSIK